MSSLATQLQRLQQRPQHDRKLSHSFLFKDADAKQFSRDQIYELATAGLQTLVSVDNRVHRYLPILFDRAHIRRERAMLTQPEQAAANAAIEAFLTFLSPHLLLTAAHQVVEYLVRVWEVHTYNATEVLVAFLPYHDHSIFARMAMLLDLRDTGFDAALSTNQLHGAPLLGSKLRELCGESRKALRTVCHAALLAVRYRVVNHGAFALFTAVATHLATHPDGEAIFRVILPVLSSLITGSVSSSALKPIPSESEEPMADGGDEKAELFTEQVEGGAALTAQQVHSESLSAALIVWCTWSQETQMSVRAITALLKPLLQWMLRSDFGLPLGDALSVVGLVFRTQSCATFSAENFAFSPMWMQLIAMPWRNWSKVVASVSGACSDMISTLVAFVCDGALRSCASLQAVPKEQLRFLADAAEILPLSGKDVRRVVLAVSRNTALHETFVQPAGGAAADATDGGSSIEVQMARVVLPSLRRRYAIATESSVVDLMRQSAATDDEEESSRALLQGGQVASTSSSSRRFVDLYVKHAFLYAGSASSSSDVDGDALGSLLSTRTISVRQTLLPVGLSLMHFIPEVREMAHKDLMAATETIAKWLQVASSPSSSTLSRLPLLLDMLAHSITGEADHRVAFAAVQTLHHWIRTFPSSAGLWGSSAGGPSLLTQWGHDLLHSLFQVACRFGQESLATLTEVAESFFDLASKLSEPSTQVTRGLCVYYLMVLENLSKQLSPASSSVCIEGVLANLRRSVPQLQSVCRAAVALRLPFALSAAHAALRDAAVGAGNASSTMAIAAAELGVIASNAVSGIVDADAAGRATSHAVLLQLESFFDPAAPRSYGSQLLAVETQRYAKRLHELRAAGHAGRGAKLPEAPSVEKGFVPSDAIATRVASALYEAVPLLSSAAEFTDAMTSVWRLLMTFGRPLPSVSDAPAVFAPVLLECLSAVHLSILNRDGAVQASATAYAIAKRWLDAAEASLTSVSDTAQHRQHTSASAETILTISVCIAMLSEKTITSTAGLSKETQLKWVRSLQSTAVEAMAPGRKKNAKTSAIQGAFAYLLSERLLSISSLSSVFEVLALDVATTDAGRTASAAAITQEAATLVSNRVLDVVPQSLLVELVSTFFPSPKSGNAQAIRDARRSNLQLLCDIFVSKHLPRVGTANDKGNHFALCGEYILSAIDVIRNESSSEVVLLERALSLPILRGDAKVVSWYKAALHALSVTLQVAPEASSAAAAASADAPTVFIAAGSKKSQTGKKATSAGPSGADEAAKQRVMDRMAPLVIQLWERYGLDALYFVALSSAGLERLFIPMLRRTHHQDEGTKDPSFMQFITETLDAMYSPVQSDFWQPQSVVERAGMLAAKDVFYFVETQLLPVLTAEPSTSSSKASHPTAALKCLTQLVRCSGSLVFQGVSDDEDDEDEATKSAPFRSLAAAAAYLLTKLPFASLARAAVTSSSATAMAPAVLQYVATVSGLVDRVESSSPSGLRPVALRHLLELITSVLACSTAPTGDDEEEEASDESAQHSASNMTKDIAGFLAKLLQTVAPLLAGGSATSSAPQQQMLHIAVLGVLLRVEALSGSEALSFLSDVDFCREVIGAFPIDSQMQIVAGLMYALMSPENPIIPRDTKKIRELLRRSATTHDDGDDDNISAVEEMDEETASLVKKIVKPNKMVNRQESILNLIVAVLKSEEFLAPFVAQQQTGGQRNRRRAAAAAKKAQDAEDDGDEAADVSEATEGGVNEHCMRLLVAALAMFAHYHDLNGATPSDVPSTEASAGALSEDKAFTMLLELLSGNALACILAGINEPTFVLCQQQLLESPHVALQRKGLETLIDRLHQSVPTVENVLTEAEAEQRRRDIRDPKKKLSAFDLVMLKARPLTTKRSMALFAPLSALSSGALKLFVKLSSSNASSTASAKSDVAAIAQYAITAAEELFRIVSSGGSLLSESVLAQGQRTLTMTEPQLRKLLGTKARLFEVRQWLAVMLRYVGSLSHAKREDDDGSEHKEGIIASQESLLLLASLVTMIATLTQCGGPALVSESIMDITRRLSQAAEFSVAAKSMDGDLARQPSRVLLRKSALNALLRSFSATWLMSSPYLPALFATVCHTDNISDPETNVLSMEWLSTAKALLEPRVLLESVCQAVAEQRVSAATHALDVLYKCLEGLLQRLPKEELSAIRVLVAQQPDPQENFWIASLSCLALSSTGSLPSSDVMNSVFDAYLAFFMKFKASQCTKFFSTVISWVFEDVAIHQILRKASSDGEGDDDDDGAANRRKALLHGASSRKALFRMIVMLSWYNRMLHKFSSIVDFTFQLATSSLVSILTAFSATSTQSQTRRRSPLDGVVTTLLDITFEVLRRMSEAQTVDVNDEAAAAAAAALQEPPYFAETSVFNALMPALVQQMANRSFLADDTFTYDQRVRNATIPCLRAFNKCLASPKLWSKTQQELLRILRSTDAAVRRAVLSAFRGLYTDGGDEMAAMIMSEMLPAVVEATEDSNEDVVEEARLLCNDLSGITGRDVLHAMA